MALTANHASSPRNVMRGFKPDTSFHVYLSGMGWGPWTIKDSGADGLQMALLDVSLLPSIYLS
jgi:hypothetical protein